MTATSQITRVDKREGPTPNGGLPSTFTRLADGLGPKGALRVCDSPQCNGSPASAAGGTQRFDADLRPGIIEVNDPVMFAFSVYTSG